MTRKVSIHDNDVLGCNLGSNTYTRGAISLIMGSTNGVKAYSDIDLSVTGNRIAKTPKDGIHVDRYIANRLTIQGNRFRLIGGQLVSVTRRSIIPSVTESDNLPF